jgi:hypothetical protein
MRSPVARLFLCWLLVLAIALLAMAQVPTSPLIGWSGWVRCQVTAHAQGYMDQQTHTWTIASGTPHIEGGFHVYPATWSVVGGGSLQRSSPTTTVDARWVTSGQSSNAPLSIWTRIADGRLIISSRRGQQRVQNGFTGYRQYAPHAPEQIAAEVFEWALPVLEEDPANTTINVSRTLTVAPATFAFMPQPGSSATASCTWQLARGAVVSPPPMLTPAATPTP